LTLRDGAQALNYLFRRGAFETRPPGNPVVMLLDIKMPKVNGLEVLRQLREDQHLRLMPVVMLTSSREERDLFTSYQTGVNAYVVKPVGYQDFVKAIKEIGLFWGLLNEPPPGSVKRTV
jgi:CheY-like chemotaxis protein